jgi:hypothetical protein
MSVMIFFDSENSLFFAGPGSFQTVSLCDIARMPITAAISTSSEKFPGKKRMPVLPLPATPALALQMQAAVSTVALAHQPISTSLCRPITTLRASQFPVSTDSHAHADSARARGRLVAPAGGDVGHLAREALLGNEAQAASAASDAHAARSVETKVDDNLLDSLRAVC